MKHNIIAKQIKITKENINKTLIDNKFNKNIGLLSLDIDETLLIIKALNIAPEIIVCEFNGVFGDQLNITVPYKKNFYRTKEHYSNLYYGCSIKALISLMLTKEYTFIGTNSAGNNAYFLQKNFKQLKEKLKIKKFFFQNLENQEIVKKKKHF